VTRLIFLGPPGAGKGTQAQILANALKVPHISTGDILRAAVSDKTELGLKAQSYMDRGELVPDQLVLDLIRERLAQEDVHAGWILDGFPRNVAQAIELNTVLQEITQVFDRVINFNVPDEALVVRLLARGRKDDNETVIRRRLEVYREQTAPLIDFYQQQLITVDGNLPMEQVTDSLRQVVVSS